MCGLTSMSISELAGLMEELGQPKFRARQVFEWISRGKRPQEMTNLPKELRDKLDTLHTAAQAYMIKGCRLRTVL